MSASEEKNENNLDITAEDQVLKSFIFLDLFIVVTDFNEIL